MKKKFLCFLMVFCILFTATSIIAGAQQLEPIALTQIGNHIMVEPEYIGSNGILIISQYNNSGELCQVNKYTADNSENYNTKVNSQAKTAKAIWVESIQSLKPIAKSIELY